MSLEERVTVLEKEVADLKLQLKGQQGKFIPEDSENGYCFDSKHKQINTFVP